MTDFPWKGLLAGIAGVVIVTRFVVMPVFRWALRNDAGGPFSQILPLLGAIGPLALVLIGGGLLVSIGWLFGLFPDDGF
jgi:hypothetical protein